MTTAPPTPDALAAYLRRRLGAARFSPDDPAGLWHRPPDARPVRRLGLALDPPADADVWAAADDLDVLLLHRPWRLDLQTLPAGVSVLAFHLALDERLGTGHNPTLAAALGLTGVRVFGRKDGRPLGMLGRSAAAPLADWIDALAALYGGLDGVWPGRRDRVRTVAVVGALSAALVDEAAAGADLYVTGQFRPGARAVAETTGLPVVAVGHARSERWALARVGEFVRQRFASVEVVPAPAG